MQAQLLEVQEQFPDIEKQLEAGEETPDNSERA
jgi:hypothetical protein